MIRSRASRPRRAPGARAAIVCLVAALVVGCAGEERAPAPPSAARPNILLISIDSLRADHLGAYGYARNTSPHIDSLAAQGTLFERMVAESSWTLPSHMTLLTGLPSRVHGVVHDGVRLDASHETLAERLAASGYRTEAYVSAPYVHPIFGFDQGFERYEVLGDTIYDQRGFRPERLAREPEWRERARAHDVASHRTRTSAELAHLVSESLGDDPSRPFFLFVHMFDVHFDYDPPEAYWRRFDPEYSGSYDPTGYAADAGVAADMPARELEHVLARYDGEIAYTDEHVGLMLARLAELGLEGQTLVALVSDHGEEFFEHGGKGHRRTLFDEQLLVPFMLRLPGRVPAGLRFPGQVRMLDVAPTLLDLAGLPAAAGTLGRSLLPFLQGQEPGDLPAISHLLWPGRYAITSLRQGRRKLLVRENLRERRKVVRLYDLRDDPGESRPLRDEGTTAAALSDLERMAALEDAFSERLGSSGNEPVELPDSMREALENLGYVWTEADEAGANP